MKRYAIYYTPPPGAFATAAATWLGYDVQTARDVAQPAVADLPGGLADATKGARKYGFHGTIKAPFRLADGFKAADLAQATRRLADGLAPVEMAGLQLVDIDGFLAFVPSGDADELTDLAAHVVRSLDPYRAALSDAEFARRNPDQLTPRQRELLAVYGYPHVMEEFRFHLTLSDRLTPADQAPIATAAAQHFNAVLPQPFVVSDICLMGEDGVGRFHLLGRYPLTL